MAPVPKTTQSLRLMADINVARRRRRRVCFASGTKSAPTHQGFHAL